jgi:hypothetical protein
MPDSRPMAGPRPSGATPRRLGTVQKEQMPGTGSTASDEVTTPSPCRRVNGDDDLAAFF